MKVGLLGLWLFVAVLVIAVAAWWTFLLWLAEGAPGG